MTPKEKFELIEKHFNNALSPEEQILFDREVSNDPDFAKEVVAQIEANHLLIDQGILDIKSKLKKIHEEETRGKNNGRWKTYLASVVALVALIASISYFYTTSTKNDSSATNNLVSTSENKNNPSSEETLKKSSDTKSTNGNNSSKENIVLHPISDEEIVKNNSIIQDTLHEEKVTQNTNPVPTKKDSANVDKNNSDKIDCSNVSITGEISTSESCTDKASGSILIRLSSLKGGKKPYSFSIAGPDEFMKVSQFSDLAGGTYKVLARDQNGCTNLLEEITIKTKACPKEYVFAPERNETFDFPIPSNANGEIKISDRGGAIVYHAFINNGYPNSWNGNSSSGVEVSMGIYQFVITYSNGDITQGSVTVLK